MPKHEQQGDRTLARLTGTYTDIDGNPTAIEPVDLPVSFVPDVDPVSGFSNATVLRAATILHYAQGLKRIGIHYYDGNVRAALSLTNDIRNELVNAQTRLGDQTLEKEISILDTYLEIMAPEAGLSQTDAKNLLDNPEIKPAVQDRPLDDHLDNLFDELLLEFEAQRGGSIAVTGFSFQDGHSADLLAVLNGKAASALDVGERVGARYILTGTVIEMSESIVVFCRVIDVQTTAVISVSQVILAKSDEVRSLL